MLTLHNILIIGTRYWQDFFQDLGRVKWQYIIRWGGGIALSTSIELDNVNSGGVSQGGQMLPPPSPKETLTGQQKNHFNLSKLDHQLRIVLMITLSD